MARRSIQHISVSLSRIILWTKNPRHEELANQAEVIARLCRDEQVYSLARDVVKHGVNPLESFALVPQSFKKKRGGPPGNYYVVEGNRRICALKLLDDPELAPPNLRKSFERLANEWAAPIRSISAVVFDDEASVKLWLERIHGGAQGGIGRRSWDASQKQRHHGGNKNRAALALLDYAEAEGIISAAERAGTLTTVQRFLNNDIFCEAMGFDKDAGGEFGRTRPKADFDVLLKRFISDLLVGKSVNSRMNKDAIVKYSRPLLSTPGVSSVRIESESLIASPRKKRPTPGKKKKPTRPEKARHVRYDEEIFTALKDLGNEKLSSLYHSICSIELDPHTPLIAVGVWSFLETLTACAGRHDNTSFDSYLSKSKLSSYGLAGDSGAIRQALERIKGCGNTTKHHPVSVLFNGDQLNNDMMLLKDVVVSCVGEARNVKAKGR